mmetsp:Transcript_2984/g.6703  ORF Transcript_2984/g.6703 Transcript_2984/m.6703 type:complete len:210 (-) Transcript_2984:499-1128(-)
MFWDTPFSPFRKKSASSCSSLSGDRPSLFSTVPTVITSSKVNGGWCCCSSLSRCKRTAPTEAMKSNRSAQPPPACRCCSPMRYLNSTEREAAFGLQETTKASRNALCSAPKASTKLCTRTLRSSSTRPLCCFTSPSCAPICTCASSAPTSLGTKLLSASRKGLWVCIALTQLTTVRLRVSILPRIDGIDLPLTMLLLERWSSTREKKGL